MSGGRREVAGHAAGAARPVPRRTSRAKRWIALAATLCGLSTLSTLARAEDDAGKPPVPPDAPSGRMVRSGPARPTGAPRRACSFVHPVCVSGDVGDEVRVLAALRQAEATYAGLRGPLRMARPDGSPLSGVFELFFVDSEVEGDTVLDELDPRSPLDRASGYARLSRRLGPGCALEVAVTRVVVRGVLLRTAPGADEGSAQAEAQAVTELLVPCAPVRAAAQYLSFQQHPERALVSRLAGESGQRFEALHEPSLWTVTPTRAAGPVTAKPPAEDVGATGLDDRGGAPHALGAALFYRWLDRGFASEPGAVLRGLFALRAAKTPPGSVRWANEPDTFDVLGKSFSGKLFQGSKLEDLLVEFALSRSRFGALVEGGASAALGDAPPVRIDWDVPWPSAPRRLAPAHPLEPTGASYLVVHRNGAPKGSRLRVEATWEEHAKMRIAFLRLDQAGRELSRGRVACAPLAVEAQMSIADLDETDRLIIVVTNVGDPSFHFDPDDVVFEPHGYELTLAAE